MKPLIRFIDKLSLLGGYAAGVMTCLGLVIVLVEIIARSLFDATIYVTDEYSGYLMCGLAFCGLAYTFKEKGHIRMVFLYKSLKDRPRLFLEIGCLTAGLIFCVFLTYYTGLFFWDSVVSGSQSMQITETYLAIPQFFMPLGSLILTLQLAAGLLRGFLILKGEMPAGELIEIAEDLGR
jgi:TRAP-type C4-dicarboxylate transport system permease small subunit